MQRKDQNSQEEDETESEMKMHQRNISGRDGDDDDRAGGVSSSSVGGWDGCVAYMQSNILL